MKMRMEAYITPTLIPSHKTAIPHSHARFRGPLRRATRLALDVRTDAYRAVVAVVGNSVVLVPLVFTAITRTFADTV